MADIHVLVDEIVNDPLARGYAGMSDAQVAADMNTEYRTKQRTSVTSSEVFNAVVLSEYNALEAGQQDVLWRLLSIGDLNPYGREADLLVQLFGAGSDTITVLSALRVELISRGVEIGWGLVKVGHVMMAMGV